MSAKDFHIRLNEHANKGFVEYQRRTYQDARTGLSSFSVGESDSITG